MCVGILLEGGYCEMCIRDRVVPFTHQVLGKNTVFIPLLWREYILFLLVRAGVAGREAGTAQTVCNLFFD